MNVGPEDSLMQRHQSAANDHATIAIARSRARSRNRRLAVYLLMMVSSGCGYFLSLGPLLMIIGNRSLPPAVDTIIKIVYAPLVWAMATFPIVENFYKRYFELIGVDL